MNGEWGGSCCRCPQERINAFPFTLFCLWACSLLCQNNVRSTQLYWQQPYHNLLHSHARKQQFYCEHVCLCELERQRECFLADLINIQPLSNPALPFSTYNVAAYPLARLQTERNLQRRRGRSEGE